MTGSSPCPELFDEYYKNTNKIELPEESKWRQYKFTLFDGKFIIVRDRVKSVEVLKKWILRFKPCHVYYSVSKWLCPEFVGYNVYNGKKAGYNVAYNLFLGGDLVIDIDGKGETVESRIIDAKVKVLKVLDILKEIGYKDFEIVFTGNKGFHIHVKDYRFPIEKFDNLLPNQKMICYYYHKKMIADYLKSRGCEFCYDVLCDIKRVVRLIGSINGVTGYICSKVEDIDRFELGRIEKYW
jgi:DNA primase small subunit